MGACSPVHSRAVPRRPAAELVEPLLEGDKRALAQAISLVENDDPEGWALVREVYPRTGNAAVVGFTGPPGVGKSTLIGRLIEHARARDREIAVLSIDPSSPFTQGALLGDRIRLSDHFLDPGVFIRSMASRGSLGGLSEATLQTALLMDASGKDDVLLETVGGGQAEVDIIDRAHIEAEGTLAERRRRNLMNEVMALATARLRRRLDESVREDEEVRKLLDEVVARRLDPASAAAKLLEREL